MLNESLRAESASTIVYRILRAHTSYFTLMARNARTHTSGQAGAGGVVAIWGLNTSATSVCFYQSSVVNNSASASHQVCKGLLLNTVCTLQDTSPQNSRSAA